METLKKYYYTYYSYEEWGRGYIGVRTCKCLPEEDIKYFGSYRDNTFYPTQKIILQTYNTREEAYADEIILHDYYDVANNPQFANMSNATSTGFYVCGEQARENGKKAGKIGGKRVKELGVGIFALTTEQRKENARKFGHRGGSVVGKITGKRHKENKTGIFGRTEEKRKKDSSKGGKIAGKITQSQRWQCIETGFISTPSGLTRYQKKRNIDTKKRIRLK
jgi:hypothetical protein